MLFLGGKGAMNELLQVLLPTLLTPVAFGLAVWAAWLLRDKIHAIVAATFLTELEVTPKGVKLKFDPEKLNAMYVKQGMGSPSSEEVKEVATLVQSLSSFVAGRRILWVDNHPEGNRLERAALVSWKVDIQTERSTEEALKALHAANDTPFDLVISDWYRNGQLEGQRLAEIMRKEAITTPILFYFMAQTPDQFNNIVDKAKALQAVGATSSPRELLRWTFAELVCASLRDKQTSFVV
jgi:hypothetical protein